MSGGRLTLLKARIDKPRAEGFVSVRHHARDIYGDYPLLPGGPIPMRVDFWVQPPVRKPGQDFIASITFIDHYGHEHKVKNIVFKGPKQ